jgi:hypothetical protein
MAEGPIEKLAEFSKLERNRLKADGVVILDRFSD